MKATTLLRLRFWNWLGNFCDRQSDKLWTEHEAQEQIRSETEPTFILGNATLH